jgi:uncharacterized protein YcnI
MSRWTFRRRRAKAVTRPHLGEPSGQPPVEEAAARQMLVEAAAWQGLVVGRILGGALVLAAGLVLLPAAASAHVRVDGGDAPGKGGYGTVRLSVPTESQTASTVGITVTIPDDVTLTSAKTLPVAGWTAKVETAGDRVTRIVWHASGAGLSPSEFGIFTFSGGPWPQDKSAVPLPTTQEYSDGSQVTWDEVSLDASEPEHPAPIVLLTDASADHHGAALVKAIPTAPESASGSSSLQWILIGLALVLSAVAAGFSLQRWLGATQEQRAESGLGATPEREHAEPETGAVSEPGRVAAGAGAAAGQDR